MKQLALATALAALLWPSSSAAQLLDGIAVVVDREVILLSEVEESANMMIRGIQAQEGKTLPPDVIQQAYREATQALIESKLLTAFAKRIELGATEEDIDRAVDNIARDESVAPEDIYRAAAEQGLSRESYRRQLGAQITRMQVISGAIESRVTVTDAEVQSLFEERYRNQKPGLRARVRHILIPWPGGGGAKSREQVREITAQIRQRAIDSGDFANLARQYSRAPSATDGGMTTFREGEIAPAIAGPVFKLPPGEVTEVIETAHGLNVFQILNRFDPSEIQLEDVDTGLRYELIERKTLPEYKKWMSERRLDSYIEIVKPELR